MPKKDPRKLVGNLTLRSFSPGFESKRTRYENRFRFIVEDNVAVNGGTQSAIQNLMIDKFRYRILEFWP